MMVRSTRSLLVDLLAESYKSFRQRLVRRLGSADIATEALHETWLDFREGGEVGTVHNPDSYIFRAALHNGYRLRRAERRYLDALEITAILDMADEAPGPERIAAGRSELRLMRRTLDTLTRRQRVIFVECYLGDGNYAALAERFGVSDRTIRSELREALLKIARRMLDKDRFQKANLRVSTR